MWCRCEYNILLNDWAIHTCACVTAFAKACTSVFLRTYLFPSWKWSSFLSWIEYYSFYEMPAIWVFVTYGLPQFIHRHILMLKSVDDYIMHYQSVSGECPEQNQCGPSEYRGKDCRCYCKNGKNLTHPAILCPDRKQL